MFFFTYTAAVLTILFVGAAAFLFLKGKKDTLTYVFVLYILANAIWIGGNAVADISTSDQMLITASGIAFVGSSCIVTFFIIFVDTFVDGKLPSLKRLIVYALPSVLFAIFSFSQYAVLDTIYPEGAPAQIVPGIQYHFFLLFLIAGLIYVLTRLVLHYKRSTGVRRLQTVYITLGFVALFAGGVTFGLILPLYGEFRFYNLAPQSSFIFAIASGYAIFKHNLLDIRIVIQRGFIYSLLFCIIISVYWGIITISGFFLQHITQTAIIINAGITTLIGIFSVPYIDRYLRKATDRFFFKDRYDYAQALYGLSENVNKTLLVEDIIKTTEAALCDILKAKAATVRYVSKDANTVLDSSRTQSEYSKTLTIPILLDDTVIGGIFLGEKLSGDYYTGQDIVLIKTFSHQIALAFEKAKLYKEVRDYSLELEERVIERTKEISRLQEEQRQMMLDISHRLQSPLTIIKSEISLLHKQGSMPPELSFFEKTVDDISAFIYDLLHLARLGIATDFLKKEKSDLSSHLLELIEYFEIIAQHEGINLVTAIEPDIELSFDKTKMTELITNLVSNAVKYIGVHGAPDTKHIRIALQKESAGALLIVADNGLGISKEDLPHIFDRFYRARHGLASTIGGTGLGLAICKKIAEIHGGTIAVESETNTGTKFAVFLPWVSTRAD